MLEERTSLGKTGALLLAKQRNQESRGKHGREKTRIKQLRITGIRVGHELRMLVVNFVVEHLSPPVRWSYVFAQQRGYRMPQRRGSLCVIHHIPTTFIRDLHHRIGNLMVKFF